MPTELQPSRSRSRVRVPPGRKACSSVDRAGCFVTLVAVARSWLIATSGECRRDYRLERPFIRKGGRRFRWRPAQAVAQQSSPSNLVAARQKGFQRVTAYANGNTAPQGAAAANCTRLTVIGSPFSSPSSPWPLDDTEQSGECRWNYMVLLVRTQSLAPGRRAPRGCRSFIPLVAAPARPGLERCGECRRNYMAIPHVMRVRIPSGPPLWARSSMVEHMFRHSCRRNVPFSFRRRPLRYSGPASASNRWRSVPIRRRQAATSSVANPCARASTHGFCRRPAAS